MPFQQATLKVTAQYDFIEEMRTLEVIQRCSIPLCHENGFNPFDSVPSMILRFEIL